VGASSIEQLEQNLAALQEPDFATAELEEIDRYATDSGLNIWADSSEN
jgi:L-glyceraldehyde 3-phosphate reductase